MSPPSTSTSTKPKLLSLPLLITTLLLGIFTNIDNNDNGDNRNGIIGVKGVGATTFWGADEWHFDQMRAILFARLDPIVAPGNVSQHMHRILGGNAFAADYNFEASRTCTCSSIYCQADCSNYWSPQIYWTTDDANSPTNNYTALPAHHRFYYKLGRNAWDVPVEPFPKGLKMLTGNANAKDKASQGVPDGAIVWNCQGPNYQHDPTDLTSSDTWNFNTSCPNQLKMDLFFPNCWDGQNLYLEGNGHMAYASQMEYGNCPVSHPIRVPMIMLENVWDVAGVAPGQVINGHLMFANGDTTGYAAHADFTNGWDIDVLRAALNDPTCVGTNQSIPAAKCASLFPNTDATIGQQAEDNCVAMYGPAPDEPGNADRASTPVLAGYNPPWSSGPHEKCPATANCTNPDISKFLQVQPESDVVTSLNLSTAATENLVTLSAANADTWQRLGCYDKGVMIGQDSFTTWHDVNHMTIDACQDLCGELGAPYAGLELGEYCHCTQTFNTSSYLVPNSCPIACVGDKSQNCGGTGRYNVQYNAMIAATGSIAPSANDTSYLGCWVGNTISEKSGDSWEDVEGCRSYCSGYTYFGLQNAYYCHCGNSLPALNGVNSLVSDIECDTPCKTNAGEMCGGLYYQSVYLVSGTYASDTITNALGLTSSTSNSGSDSNATSVADLTPAQPMNKTSSNLVSESGSKSKSTNQTNADAVTTCSTPTATVTLPASTQTVIVNAIGRRQQDQGTGSGLSADGCTTTVDGPAQTVLAMAKDGSNVVMSKRHLRKERAIGRGIHGSGKK